MPLTYRAKPGDTLASIAARFGLTVEQLLQLNPNLLPPETSPTPIVGETTLAPGAFPEEPRRRMVDITGAPITTGREPVRSPAVESIIGGVGGDFGAALNFIMGQGVSQLDMGLLSRIAPELSQAFEGVNAQITARAEQEGQNPLLARTLTPLEFLEDLQRTGTLAAMMKNPALTGVITPQPAVTARRVRI